MELATGYTQKLNSDIAYFFYLALIGEPALGPAAFMHRLSALEIPAAPLTHHWMDSTHIASSVITAGIDYGKFRFEASTFHGQEPGENRLRIDLGAPDSWSVRLWYLPTPEWALQLSHGHLSNPERTSRGNVERSTASVSYTKTWESGYWANTLAWGINQELLSSSQGVLIESTVNFEESNYIFVRAEAVSKHGLAQSNIFGRPGLTPLPAAAEAKQETVAAVTLGYERTLYSSENFRLNAGADATLNFVPADLKPIYGGAVEPAVQVFIHLTPGKM